MSEGPLVKDSSNGEAKNWDVCVVVVLLAPTFAVHEHVSATNLSNEHPVTLRQHLISWLS